MRQFLSFERWPQLALLELKLDIEILRAGARQKWVSRRMNARFRRSLAWRKDFIQLLNASTTSEAYAEYLADAPWDAAEDATGSAGASGIAEEVRRFVAPSTDFEELQPDILDGRVPRAKVIAFYLPQFHPFAENDRWWGPGFTEWTNVARAVPRFEGHYQPRIPRDLGFYDLRDDYTMRRQIEMAKQGGVHGFCFYYYNFDGKRLLEMPIERFLADPSLDMPFCLMWANENWTRRWDGAESEVLMQQSYAEDKIELLVDDLARYARDPRYIQIDGRPLIIVYRPNVIPNAQAVVARWREMFLERHGLSPILFMVQAFGSDDPAEFGFDGAIEFPPHKLHHRAAPVNGEVQIYDARMTGQIFRYRDFVAASLSFRPPTYPLLRTLFPSWDNDARRQGHGMSTTGSTPALYRYWLDKMIQFATRHPVFDETMVFVNAWNEWAEGTYLEPDIHFGGAYLNETARAVAGLRSPRSKQKILLVGHDANPHGAQELLLNIGEMLKRDFGCEIEFLLCGNGPLLDRYQAVAPTRVISPDSAVLAISDLSARGFVDALVNSVASGFVIEMLRSRYFRVITLVHELPEIIKTFHLEASAQDVARGSSELVFPSTIVRDAFRSMVGEFAVPSHVRPQGLYKALVTRPGDRTDVRRELGVSPDAKLIINVGYGDMRKGIDLFADLAARFLESDPNVHFVWVGLTEKPTVEALGARLDLANLHFLGQRNDVGRLLAAADVFALTSREDPFPSVVLEALATGLPVVAFAGAGGFVDLFAIPETGTLVPLADVEAMAGALHSELARPDGEREAGAAIRRETIAASFSFRDYVFWLLQRVDPSLVRVSVVVPNYNYARYLDQRLGTIFDQSYPLYEIIVLDDASTDGSAGRAREIAEAAGRRVRLVENETNSGSVFRQWRKGADLAAGDLVWIAEADDLSRPEFLASLAQKFTNPDVKLAFCDSGAIDADGNRLGANYQYYYNTVEPGVFAKSFTMDAEEFAVRFLSERNIILNVSAVLWSRDRLSAVLNAGPPDATSFTIAGDWLLYLRACRLGGSVYFQNRALNTHRRAHGVTARTRGEVQLREIGAVYEYYDQSYALTDRLRDRRAAYLEQLRQQFANDP